MKLEVRCPKCAQVITTLGPTLTDAQIARRIRYAFRLHWKRSIHCRRAEDTNP